MVIKKAYFIDTDYIVRENKTYIRFTVKGKVTTHLYMRCDPYFYVDAPIERKDDLKKIISKSKSGEVVTPLKAEICEKNLFGLNKKLIKLYCNKPMDVPILREAIPFTCYEHRIPFAKRVIIDLQITPFSVMTYEREGREIKKIIKIEEGKQPHLNALAFDIETYNPVGAPRETKDPAIMISYYSPKEEKVLTYKKINKEFVKSLADEKEMLEEFISTVRRLKPDLIVGYNSANFDLPYLDARAKKYKLLMALGKGKRPIKKIKKGLITGVSIDGRIHLDAYPAARFFGFIGLIKARQFTLESIYHEITGKSKKMVKRLNIWEMWDKDQLDELSEYSLMDAKATYEVGQFVLPLQMELSGITKMPLFDVSLSTSGQLVESLLMFNAFKRNEIVPSKPSDSAVKERTRNPIQGAFVKLPAPGIYENIAVLDFRGLYPSIIISYNIDPFTVMKGGGGFTSPSGTTFSEKTKGLIPETLDFLVDFRTKIKHELNKLDKDSDEYKRLHARQFGLKILANSFYGYLAYPRSRWYSRECGESTTAWGRKHIEDAILKAVDSGFSVLYGDTDSVFLVLGDKKKEDVYEFMEKVNKELPEKMELELEGFYSRGVFVSKKGEERGAKKKYALMGEDGRIKIRGFELVRRDWSSIAKDTQLKVLQAILKEGSKEKAVKIVRETIERVRSGTVPLEELAINTQLNKNPKNYEVASPELSAAVKGVKHGLPLEKGSVISFVITKTGKTISEKAEILEFAKDYDADYYINHQILPSVLKILKELGFDEHGLKFGGKQKSLDSFF